MKSVFVLLSNPSDIQQFVEIISALEGEFELVSGNYILDARSLMGIFSMDISRPIELRIHQPNQQTMQVISRFIVNAD